MCKRTTPEMDALLRSFGKALPEERSPTTTEHYTCHAFKKGALDQLVQRASKVKDFPTYLVPLLAKHKSEQEQMPAVTMGYLNHPSSRIAMARLLQTHRATELLDPV